MHIIKTNNENQDFEVLDIGDTFDMSMTFPLPESVLTDEYMIKYANEDDLNLLLDVKRS